VQPVFAELLKHYDINTVFSHQEIGNKCTFDRDLTMKVFFKITKSTGKSQMHGVIRRLKSRQHWDKRWEEVMRAEPKIIDVSHLNLVQLNTFYDAIRERIFRKYSKQK
jgi:deoxyribodipyrimidine photo-lyase